MIERLATVSVLPARAVHVWTAHPKDFRDGQWFELASWLDASELLCSFRFSSEADRRAYILAHALRRLALSAVLAVPPAELVFSSEASGQPVLVNPPGELKIHFSHSRSRTMVACAVTCIGPVGIDVEVLDTGNADMSLLGRFMVLPDAQPCQAGPAVEQARQFFFYWTVLEAYWKAKGCGLSFANPAITCQKNRTGWFDLSLLAGTAWLACGQALALQSPADCAATLVLDASCFKAGSGNVEVVCHPATFFHDGSRSLKPQMAQHTQCSLKADVFLNV